MKTLQTILAESFDTGDPRARHAKWYVRKVNKTYFGRFVWNGLTNTFQRKGGKYSDRQAAIDAAKVSAL